ncbi:allophanate hydrolase [Kibdelosporangium philippinense]|uniref:Allophanate hydrolase n=1 Tax=Kibdelosporangium philippinense TaxID=211113 RepID=A0ABS8ZV63_9PSEU|nr:allophanate hydrolase [Kibdelosporangium philippinense]MCE7010308.1 allophanate hydrolase [Kibdelosporangium philippinense]
MSAVERVKAAYRRIAEVDRPEVWITLRDSDEVLAEAAGVRQDLPLAGLVCAVKDNIDVAGIPTTAACPAFAYTPTKSATVVQRLRDAGAVVLGKTNLDQFATGLVGTRSPSGAVRHAHRPDRISGGSSSGSAVAVALGIVDFSLGTDTAGSGRVPAALHGIVGFKPTLGLLPNTGVVPAARPYDSVSVFTADLALAQRVMAVLAGPDVADPGSRDWPVSVRLAAGPRPVVAVPTPEGLAPLSVEARAAFIAAVESLRSSGVHVSEVDISVFVESAKLLYDGALVAERYAAVGEFLAEHQSEADPTVSGIILAAGKLPAHQLASDQARLAAARTAASVVLEGIDALLLPTTVGHPTLAEVAADPVGVYSKLGTYTNFVNLLDLAAVAVPAGQADGSPFGVSVITRAFDDQVALDLAALLTGEVAPEPFAPSVGLAVFGAHLRGRPLNHQLTSLGARFDGEIATAPKYRMFALPTDPPKPGVVRSEDGASLRGERWLLSTAALGTFLAGLPAPMSLGRIRLDTGEEVLGFQCDPVSAAAGKDITTYASWPAWPGS